MNIVQLLLFLFENFNLLGAMVHDFNDEENRAFDLSLKRRGRTDF